MCVRYLTEAEPWKMKGADEARRPAIVRTTLEALYAFMHLLAPILPIAAQTGRNFKPTVLIQIIALQCH